jgi:serine-type D-Ala-D-Ala carboxypeptidase/endopeptidase (penicillin-binding protein 4)
MKNYLLAALTCMFIFSSCSVTEKTSRSARKNILNASAFSSAHTGITIYEPSTGKYWYNFQADKYFVPASNTKLASCYAAMKYLGDSLPGIHYEVIHDSVIVLKGAADPTFLHGDFKEQRVFDFLKNFPLIQIIEPSFTEYLGNGWSWNDYEEYYMAQRSEWPVYGNIVTITKKNDAPIAINPPYFSRHSSIIASEGSRQVHKPWDTNFFTIPDAANLSAEVPFRPDNETLQQLLEDTLHRKIQFISQNNATPDQVLHSIPTDSLLKIMMHRSDNFFAEQSLLMVSDKLLGQLNVRKTIDTLLKSDFLAMPQKPGWADGSGLSRYNLFSPLDFIFILEKMKSEFGMERIKNILPTGGTGTISNYYQADSGSIFVKTGTLNGVVALSGFLYTKKQKLLLFSILVNNHRASAADIRKQVEKFIKEVRNRN